jgi:transcription elongation factor Elf1
MIYKCPRCGYETNVNTNFKKHLTLKTIICSPIIADVSLEDIKQEFFNKKINNKLECNWCKKKYSSVDTLRTHTKNCKLLPKIQKENHEINTISKPFKTEKDRKIDSLKLELLYYKNRNNKNNENYFQKFLETVLGGSHKRLECGITDITTDKFHAEIKNFPAWKEAIGQLICYNMHDPKKEMRLYLFGSHNDEKLNMVYEDCKSLNINVYNIVNNKDDTISICNIDTSEVNIYKASGELIE